MSDTRKLMGKAEKLLHKSSEISKALKMVEEAKTLISSAESTFKMMIAKGVAYKNWQRDLEFRNLYRWCDYFTNNESRWIREAEFLERIQSKKNNYSKNTRNTSNFWVSGTNKMHAPKYIYEEKKYTPIKLIRN